MFNKSSNYLRVAYGLSKGPRASWSFSGMPYSQHAWWFTTLFSNIFPLFWTSVSIWKCIALPLSNVLDYVKCRFWRPGQDSTRSQLRHWILHLCIHQSWWHITCVTALWWNALFTLLDQYLEFLLESKVEFITSLGMLVSSKKHLCLFCLISSMKVTPEDVRKLNLPPECINKTPSGETFVKSNLQKVEPF